MGTQIPPQLLEGAIESLGDLFCVFPPEETFTEWNDKFSAITGYSDAEISNLTPTDIVPETEREEVTAALETVTEDLETVRFATVIETKTGNQIPYEFQWAPVSEGEAVAGIGWETTDRKQVVEEQQSTTSGTQKPSGSSQVDNLQADKEQLREEKSSLQTELEETTKRTLELASEMDEHYRQLFDSAFDGIYSTTESADEYVQANQAYADLLGYESPEALCAAVDSIEEDVFVDSGKYVRYSEKLNAVGELNQFEYRVRTADGEIRWISDSVRALTEYKSDLEGYRGSVIDITKKKNQEGALKRQTNLSIVLNRVLRHNLRNDITVVRGFTQMMTNEMDDESYGEKALRSIDSLIELSEKARVLDKIVASDADPEPADIPALIEGVATQMRREHPSATISVVAEGEGEITAAVLPSFKRAIQELLENAVKHSGDEPRVNVEIEANLDDVQIRIADNGPGIAEEEAAVLRSGSETPLLHGSGLGLYLTNWIVTSQEGVIDATATEEGTTLSILVPRTPSEGGAKQLADMVRARDQYKSAFKEAGDGMTITDDEARILDVNKEAARIFGEDKQALLGRPIREFISEDFDFEAEWGEIKSAEMKRGEMDIITGDGGVSPIEYTAKSHIVPGQHLIASRDITDRKEREKKIEESEAKYRNLFEESRDALMLLDRDGFFDCNRRTLDLFGFESVDAFVNNAPWDLSPATQPDGSESEEMAKRHVETAMKTGEAFFEWTHERRDGTEFLAEVKLSRYYQDGEPAIHALVRDITERKEKRKRFEFQKSLATHLTELANDLLQVGQKNIDTKINAALETIGSLVDGDRSYVFDVNLDEKIISNTHEWTAEGVDPQIDNLQDIPFDALPWWMAKLQNHEPLTIEDVSGLPPEASAAQEVLQDQNIQSLIVSPMVSEGDLIGFIGFDWLEKQSEWSEDFIQILRVSGELISSAIKRESRRRELERREAYLEQSSDSISVLDDNGELKYQSVRSERETEHTPNKLINPPGFEHIHPEHRSQFKKTFASFVSEPDTELQEELRVEAKDGGWKWIKVWGKNKLNDPVIDGLLFSSRNITERKEREHQIQRLKERLELAVEGADLGVWDWDFTTGEIKCNERCVQMLGYSADEFGHDFEAWKERVHPDDIAAVEAKEEAHRAGETSSFELEFRLETAKGDWKWIRRMGRIVDREEDGTPIRAVGIHIDISERKEQQDRLHQEQKRFKALFQQFPEPTIASKIENGNTVIQAVNPAFEEVFGYDADEIIGESINELIVPADKQEEAREIDAVSQEGELVERELRRKTRHGERKFLFKNIPIPGDADTDIYGVYVNITDRKQHENAVKALHEAALQFGKAGTTDEVYELLTDTTEEILDFPLVTVDVREEDALIQQACSLDEDNDDCYERTPLLTEDSLAARAYNREETIVADDLREYDVTPADPDYLSALTVPIGASGVFQTVAREASGFDDADREMAELLVDHAQEALQRLAHSGSGTLAENILREYIPHPYQSLTPKGKIRSVNEAELNFLGKERENVVNKWFIDFLTENSREKFKETLTKLKNEGSVSRIEFELYREDGTLRLVSFDGQVEFDEAGDIVQIHCQFNDITERKKYKTFIENSPDISLLLDEAGMAKFVSPSVKQEMGYDPGSLLGQNAFNDIHPDDRAQMAEAFSQLNSDPETVETVEYRIQDAEGSYVWVETRGQNLTNEVGIDGILLNARVVEERKTYEEKLERMEYIVQNMNDGVVIVQDGIIVYANPRVSELVGYAEDEIIGSPIGDYIGSEFWETVNKRQQAGMSGDDADLQNQYELELVSADGEHIPVEVNIAPIENEGQTAGLTTIRDITERKWQEERFQELLEHSNDVISVLGPDGTYKYQSPSSKRVTGYDPNEMVGKNAFEYVHPEDRERVMEEYSEAKDGSELLPNTEFRFRQKDGSYQWLATRGNNQLDNPAIEGFIVNSRDITKRKERQHELQRERDRLDRFAGVLSHDLRNPLNVATGRLDLATEECESDHLETVEEALDRMETLIDDVLTLARAGETVGESDAVRLPGLIDGCWGNVDTKSAELVAETDTTIQADKTRLKQLFENLFRNAVEHGGDDVTVTVGEFDDGIYVEDDGSGVPGDDEMDIFEPGNSENPEGTGFGLSIVEQIAEAHGWEVRLAEGSGEGARFEITGVDVGGE